MSPTTDKLSIITFSGNPAALPHIRTQTRVDICTNKVENDQVPSESNPQVVPANEQMKMYVIKKIFPSRAAPTHVAN